MTSRSHRVLAHTSLAGMMLGGVLFFTTFQSIAAPATQPAQAVPVRAMPIPSTQPAARPVVTPPPARTTPFAAQQVPDAARAVPTPSAASDRPSARAKPPTIQTTDRTDRYDMYFRHKKVGEFTRTEKHLKSGAIEVHNESQMNIKMLFTTVKAVNQSVCFYDQHGELTQFTITSTVRGKITTYTGKRDQHGLTITQTQGKKKIVGFFPAHSFQGTSLDYRFPSAHPGIHIRRQYLVIPRMQIVEQSLTYREAIPRKVFGQVQPVYEITISNQRGRGMVLVTQDGHMIASRMLGRLGVVEIRWNGSK